jgi:hypothetical protein
VFDYFVGAESLKAEADAIRGIGDKLETGAYANPLEWIQDVKTVYNEIVHKLGPNTDISLAILTVAQMIEESAETFICPREKPKIEALDAIISDLREIGEISPSNVAEYERMSELGIRIIPPQIVMPEAEPKPKVQSTDLQDIYRDVMALPSDKDLEKIVDIVSRYELVYSHTRGVIEIDLTKCQPYTLDLIKGYIQQAKNRE